MRCHLLVCTSIAVTAAVSPAAARLQAGRAPTRPPARKANGSSCTAGAYRISLERVVQNSSLSLHFSAAAGQEESEPRHTASLYLIVAAPDVDRAAAIVGLQNLTAFTDTGQALDMRDQTSADGGAAEGPLWRTQLLVSDIAMSANSLREIRGQLTAYPHVQRVRTELSLKPGVQETAGPGGLHTTLHDVKFDKSSVAVTLSQRWPAATSVSKSRPDAPFGATFVDAAGSAVLPDEAQQLQMPAADGEKTRKFKIVRQLPDSEAERPQKVVVESLVRWGMPVSYPLSLGPIQLPDTAGDSSITGSPGSSLPADHAFRAEKDGATLEIDISGVEASNRPGVLSVGLSAAGANHPTYRWAPIEVDHRGIARISGLRAGSYRVRLLWRRNASTVTGNAPSAWMKHDAVFTAPARSMVRLQPLRWQAEETR